MLFRFVTYFSPGDTSLCLRQPLRYTTYHSTLSSSVLLSCARPNMFTLANLLFTMHIKNFHVTQCYSFATIFTYVWLRPCVGGELSRTIEKRQN
jgi:hypothetical protein